jgi:ring-1,2-phenylacetyl-CoA epoxidase subunit PaaE
MENYHLKIRKITQETADAITVEFEQPKIGKIDYKPGQFLTLILHIEGKEHRRAYSLCTSPEIDEFPAITIKKVGKGVVSNHLNSHLKVGDTLEVMPPMGFFTTEFNAENERHLVLLGGGSGITPLMSILKTTLALEPKSVVYLIYANQDNSSIIFKEKLEALQKQYASRFQVIHILEKAPLFWNKGYKGRINTKMLEKILNSLPSQIQTAEFFMCGPAGMMNQITQSFDELKLPKDKLHKESFGISPEEAASKKASIESDPSQSSQQTSGTKSVKVIYSGETYVFDVPANKSILFAAMDQGISLPFSCQSGMCTACMGRCTSGKVKLDEEDALTPKELEKGYVLTCVGHPMTDDVVIEID